MVLVLLPLICYGFFCNAVKSVPAIEPISTVATPSTIDCLSNGTHQSLSPKITIGTHGNDDIFVFYSNPSTAPLPPPFPDFTQQERKSLSNRHATSIVQSKKESRLAPGSFILIKNFQILSFSNLIL